MEEQKENYGLVYKSAPPYEVLFTKWISYEDVLRLKGIEEMVEVYYNSRQFEKTLEALEKEFASMFDMYEKILKPSTAHISTIPNTPISVGEGIVVCESKHSLNEEQMNIFMNLFKDVALVEMVDTHLLSIGGTIGGCTPAYAAMFIEALGDAGVDVICMDSSDGYSVWQKNTIQFIREKYGDILNEKEISLNF